MLISELNRSTHELCPMNNHLLNRESNLYIHARTNQIKYFNTSYDRENGYVYKTDRFYQDPGFIEILDSILTKEDMENCNIVIS